VVLTSTPTAKTRVPASNHPEPRAQSGATRASKRPAYALMHPGCCFWAIHWVNLGQCMYVAKILPTGPGGPQAGFSTPRYVSRGFGKTNRVRGLLAPPVVPRSWVP
jgi:hypothetical protein